MVVFRGRWGRFLFSFYFFDFDVNFTGLEVVLGGVELGFGNIFVILYGRVYLGLV